MQAKATTLFPWCFQYHTGLSGNGSLSVELTFQPPDLSRFSYFIITSTYIKLQSQMQVHVTRIELAAGVQCAPTAASRTLIAA